MQKLQAVSIQEVETAGWHDYDPWLVLALMFLLAAGLVMVASSSVALGERLHDNPLYYFQRQAVAVVLGLALAFVIVRIPVAVWQKLGLPLLFLALALLALVLVPGVGREVNGSVRWIKLGPINFQASELAKLCVISYIAAYLAPFAEARRQSFIGFLPPILVVTLLSGLLLLEPDYGTVVVIFLTTVGVLFLAGIPAGRFFLWLPVMVAALAALAVIPAYRLARLKAFIDPWQDPFNSGYQLIQSLIAFGRGEWFGVGLGSSVQKLFYLTQAHTDFIFAIAAEELGLLFSLLIASVFFFFIWRAFGIAAYAQQSRKYFAAYMAYGIGLLIGIQAFIHMGVNVGLLPTKGLTLPLFSYGANSIVVSCMLVAILLRIDLENRYPRGIRICKQGGKLER